MSLRALLDVNVLIALLDGSHVHHDRASAWLQSHARDGWASCPITQNGCLRIMSQMNYTNPLSIVEVAQRLAEAAAHPRHEFWADSASLLQAGRFDWRRLLGPRQVTDVYLLALAIDRGGRLVTLDRGIPLQAIKGAKDHHCVVLA